MSCGRNSTANPSTSLFFSIAFFASFLFAEQDLHDNLTLEDRTFLLEGDYLGYALDDNIITGTGNVKMSIGRLWIQADSLQLSVKKRLLHAQGNVLLGSLPKEAVTDDEKDNLLQEKEKLVTLKLQGDAVVLDLHTAQGSLYRVREDVEVIYFLGEDLLPLSSPLPSLTERIPVPDLQNQNIAMTAKRIKMRLGNRMEAWKVAFYHKGYSIIRIPYYTTAAEEFVRDIPFHIRDLGYSSSSGFKTTLQYPYLHNRKAPGFLDFFYQQKTTNKKLRANLQQHWNISQKTKLRLNVQDLTSSSRRTDFGFQHHFSDRTELQAFLSHSSSFPISSRLLFLRKLERASFLIEADWLKQQGTRSQTKLNYQYSLFPPPTGIFTPRVVLSGFWGTDINHRSTYDQSMSVEVVQSAIRLHPKIWIDDRIRVNTGFSKIGGVLQTDHTFTFRNNLIFPLSYSTQFLLGYEYSEHKAEQKNFPVSTKRQTLISRLSFGRQNNWGALIQANYDLLQNKINQISPSFNAQLTRKWRLRISSSYDPLSQPHWRNIQTGFQYAFLGEKDRRFLQMIFSYDRTLRKFEYSFGIPYLQ